MMLHKHIAALSKAHSLTSVQALAELLTRDASALRETVDVINKQGAWLYLTKQTYDGWYCLKADSKWSVYYQERGLQCYGSYEHTGYSAAIADLIDKSGYFSSCG